MSTKRFRIAFSFAGERRDFVAKVAALLAKRFGGDKILYDKFHEAEFADADLAFDLPEYYHSNSDLIVAVFCRDYDTKEWCRLEWRSIFALIKKGHSKGILLSRFDHADGKGLADLSGFIELDAKTPAQFAKLILERLALNEGKARNHYTDPLRTLIPNNLPLLPHFFGRDKELRAISEALNPAKQLWGALILGPGGIGKTSLAIRAASSVEPGKFKCILFLSAKVRILQPDGVKRRNSFQHRGYLQILRAVAKFLGRQDLKRTQSSELAQTVITELRGKKLLLVLDNLESLPVEDQDQVFQFVSLLPPGCKAIVTSRKRRDEEGRIIELGKLNKTDALKFIEELAQDRPRLARAEKETRVQLYEETGGNPLLIRWVVGQLGRGHCLTIAKAINFLKKAPQDNDPLEFIFGDLAGTMSESEIKAIKGLSALTKGLGIVALAKRAGISVTAATTVLNDLSDRGLIDADNERKTFSVLPIVVAYVQNYLTTNSQQSRATRTTRK